jgi:hypothetical protein
MEGFGANGNHTVKRMKLWLAAQEAERTESDENEKQAEEADEAAQADKQE